MYEYLLPIGSVVKLKEANKLLMVFGILQTNPAVSDITFDYIGVPYPEGHFDIKLQLGFNHDNIEEVIFKGYQSEERDAFMGAMEIIGSAKLKGNQEV